MEYYPNAVHEKAQQGGDVLFSFVCAVIAVCVLATFGEPFLARQLGSGVPWWVYALLFSRFAGAVAQVLMDDSSLLNADSAHDRPKMGIARLFMRDLPATRSRLLDTPTSDGVVRFIRDQESACAPTTGPQFDAFLAREIQKWGRIVKTSGATTE